MPRTWIHIFTDWRGRINRKQFLGGNALLLIGVCFAVGVVLLASAIVGGRGVDLMEPIASSVIFLGMIPQLVLIAQRAHDIGWSAYGPVCAFGLVLAAHALTTIAFYDAIDGVFRGWLAALGPSMFWIAFWCSAAAMPVMASLIVTGGQSSANRFGSPPVSQ